MTNPLLKVAALAARMLPMSVKRSIYSVKPLAGWIRRGLNRASPQGLTSVEVAGGAIQGYRLELDLHTEKDYWLGTYEPNLQAALKSLVKPGWTAYDIGANIGYISLILAQMVGKNGRVFAFEALPANLDRMRKNLSLNHLDLDRVEIVPRAVTIQPGMVQFLVHSSGEMGKIEGSAGRQVAYESSVSIPGVSVDAFVFDEKRPPPQVVKMDIEGGEVLALPGMQRVLETYHPVMLLELHGPESNQVAWDVLSRFGYQFYLMQPGYPPVNERDGLGWKAYCVAK